MVDATQRIGWGCMGWSGCVFNVSCTCTYGRANKATLQVNTGAIDGWWTRAKDSIPPSLHTLLGTGEANRKIFQCVQRYAWRWEHTGTNLMAETGQRAHKMSFGA